MITRAATSVELRCDAVGCLAFMSIGRMNHAPTDEDVAALRAFAVKRGWCGDTCPKHAPAQNVEAGETRLYGVGSGNSAAVVRIRADGSIEVTAKSAAKAM